MKTRVAQNITAQTMAENVTELVSPKAHLQTGEVQAYKAIGRRFATHERVRHNAGMYIRFNATACE